MQTKVSSRGQVFLPDPIRRKLGLVAGDELRAEVENGNVVLIPNPKTKTSKPARIVISLVTGLPVIEVDKDATELTSEMVREMLADFP